MPAASVYEEGTNSGLWLAVADPEATVTALGVVTSCVGKVAGGGRSEAQKNASLLGKVFATRIGECALMSSDTQDLVDNACRSSEGYSLEAGFRRSSSRLAVPNTRAAWSARDVPLHFRHFVPRVVLVFGLEWAGGPVAPVRLTHTVAPFAARFVE